MRILGIDQGSYSIKLVETESAFRRHDLHDFHEHVLAPGENPDQILIQMIAGLKKKPDRTVICLPSETLTLRNLQFPTRDKKIIQSSITFELEDDLPFSLEEAFYDYTILSQSKKGSYIHVATTLKRHLVQALMKLENAELDPDVLTSPVWAYRTYLNRSVGLTAQESPVLLLNIGHRKTVFYLQYKGVPTFIRTCSWGGFHLTRAIAQKFNLDPNEAESAKIDRGVIITGDPEKQRTSEEIDMSQCIEKELEKLFIEIRQTELMAKGATNLSTAQIYLTGGSSQLAGIQDWIQLKTAIPTKKLQALSSVSTSEVSYSEQTDARFLLAAAQTLCLVGSDRSNCLNYRKGEFAKSRSTREFNTAALKKPLLAAATILIFLFTSMLVQSWTYNSRLDQVNGEIKRSVRNFFGRVPNSRMKTYLLRPKVLKESVTKELQRYRELESLVGSSNQSPLDFLRQLSTKIPKSVTVDLVQFDAGIPKESSYLDPGIKPTTELIFLVANSQVSEKVAELVEPTVAGMEKDKLEEVFPEDGGPSKWKLKLKGSLTGDSYGK